MLLAKFEVSQSSLTFRVLQTCCSPTAEMVQTYCCPAAEELQNHLEMAHTKFEVCRSSVTCSRWLQNFCRYAADLLLPCSRGAVESPLDYIYQSWSLYIKCMFYRTAETLQTVGNLLQNHLEILHTNFEVSRSSIMLECCITAVSQLHRYCRTAADLLQVHLEMLHARF